MNEYYVDYKNIYNYRIFHNYNFNQNQKFDFPIIKCSFPKDPDLRHLELRNNLWKCKANTPYEAAKMFWNEMKIDVQNWKGSRVPNTQVYNIDLKTCYIFPFEYKWIWKMD